MNFGRQRREERRRPQVELNLLDDGAAGGGLLGRARRAWRLPALGAGLAVAVLLALRLGGHL
jgi:hypothetical protein